VVEHSLYLRAVAVAAMWISPAMVGEAVAYWVPLPGWSMQGGRDLAGILWVVPGCMLRCVRDRVS